MSAMLDGFVEVDGINDAKPQNQQHDDDEFTVEWDGLINGMVVAIIHGQIKDLVEIAISSKIKSLFLIANVL